MATVMGLSYSTLKWMAPASFLIDFAAQQYGMMSKPNMLDIHEKNLSFFSPQPYFIPAFFFPQQLFQLAWLYRLWKLDPKKPSEKAEFETMADFVPFYTLGNLCIATWMIFWNANDLKTSNIFVLINSITQVLYLTRIGTMNTKSTSSVLTHIVAKTFAGIGILDFLHNGSAAYFVGEAPSTLIKVGTGLFFGIGALMSDWIFGGCLTYDLIALAAGQTGDWRNLLAAYAAASGAIVVGKNYLKPPYVAIEEGYNRADDFA